MNLRKLSVFVSAALFFAAGIVCAAEETSTAQASFFVRDSVVTLASGEKVEGTIIAKSERGVLLATAKDANGVTERFINKADIKQIAPLPAKPAPTPAAAKPAATKDEEAAGDELPKTELDPSETRSVKAVDGQLVLAEEVKATDDSTQSGDKAKGADKPAAEKKDKPAKDAAEDKKDKAADAKPKSKSKPKHEYALPPFPPASTSSNRNNNRNNDNYNNRNNNNNNNNNNYNRNRNNNNNDNYQPLFGGDGTY